MGQLKIKSIIAITFAIFLTGCGGGGGGGDDTPDPGPGSGEAPPPSGNSNWDQLVWDQDKWT